MLFPRSNNADHRFFRMTLQHHRPNDVFTHFVVSQ